MTMRGLMSALGLFAAVSACAGEHTDLWPSESQIPDFMSGQYARWQSDAATDSTRMPYLDWCTPPANPNGACMILVSGGGYNAMTDMGQIGAMDQDLTAIGFQCAKLVYRTGRPSQTAFYRSGWQDAQRAVRVARSQAAARGFNPDKVGMIGHSAGGHITMLMAVSSMTPAYARVDALDDQPCNLNWAVCHSPAYNTLQGETGGGQTENVGITETPVIGSLLKFDAQTCPVAFLHGGLDPYTPNGSTLAYAELHRRNIPTEIHLYNNKTHNVWGFSPNMPGAGTGATGESVLDFLRQMGFAGTLGPEESLLSRYPGTGDRYGEARRVDLWPENQIPDYEAGQITPYLEWHLPSNKGTKKAIMIVFAGEDYDTSTVDGYAVTPIRQYLNGKNIAVVTLKYRTPHSGATGKAKHTAAWQDLQRAIRIVRTQARARDLDPDRIGIMGTGAGGHLAMLGALSSTEQTYAPIDAYDEKSCVVKMAVAVSPTDILSKGVLAPEFKVDANSCTIAFFGGDVDTQASSVDLVRCWEQLRAKGVQCDLHVLASRGHDFLEQAAPGTGSYSWMDRVMHLIDGKGMTGFNGWGVQYGQLHSGVLVK